MSRWWTDRVAALGDHIPLGLVVLLLLLVAGLVGAGLYWWPAWLPWRWFRLTGARWPQLRWPWHWHWSLRWRWPWRRRRRAESQPPRPQIIGGDELPDLTAAAFLSLADQLAAQGRYAEAIRERLRAIVRELIDAGLIDNRPGWTVTELAATAAAARPPVRPGLDPASGLFPEIWYGQRPATVDDDRAMREHVALAHDALSVQARVGVR